MLITTLYHISGACRTSGWWRNYYLPENPLEQLEGIGGEGAIWANDTGHPPIAGFLVRVSVVGDLNGKSLDRFVGGADQLDPLEIKQMAAF
jgi:hypothetical protein